MRFERARPEGAVVASVGTFHEERGCRQRRALAPAVTKLSLAAGPLPGGSKRKITGLNFKAPDVTSVHFAGTLAWSSP